MRAFKMAWCARRSTRRLQFSLLPPSCFALALLLIVCCGEMLTRATAAEDSGRHATCGIEFAPRYFATIATTMPVADHTPLAHTGHLFVDEEAGALRIDQFLRGHRVTLLVDNRRLRGVVFFGERSEDGTAQAASDEADSAADADDAPRRRCHVFYLPRPVTRFCVPHGYAAAAQPSVVRGVAATAFTGMEGFPGMPLVEQIFHVINGSRSADTTSSSASSFLPWRLEYRARPDLEPHKIAPAPTTLPNWRLFGHPMFDELVLSPAEAAQLQRWQPAIDLMTIDFYDYDPTEHPPNTFAVPPQCTAVLRRSATARGADGDSAAESEGRDDETTSAADAGLPQLQLATLQRFLLQWHRLQNVTTRGEEKKGVLSPASDLLS